MEIIKSLKRILEAGILIGGLSLASCNYSNEIPKIPNQDKKETVIEKQRYKIGCYDAVKFNNYIIPKDQLYYLDCNGKVPKFSKIESLVAKAKDDKEKFLIKNLARNNSIEITNSKDSEEIFSIEGINYDFCKYCGELVLDPMDSDTSLDYIHFED